MTTVKLSPPPQTPVFCRKSRRLSLQLQLVRARRHEAAILRDLASAPVVSHRVRRLHGHGHACPSQTFARHVVENAAEGHDLRSGETERETL